MEKEKINYKSSYLWGPHRRLIGNCTVLYISGNIPNSHKGFLHEQSRPDRDQYVDIKFDNMWDGADSQYTIIPTEKWDHLGHQPFDVKSTMLYDGMSASKNGKPTMLFKGTNQRHVLF